MARLLVFAILLVCLAYVCQARPQNVQQQPTSDFQGVSKFLKSMVNGATEKLSGISRDIVSNESLNKAVKNTWDFASRTSDSIKKGTEKLFDKIS